MRTRYKKYRDYGLTKEVVQETYRWLNNLQPEQKKIVKEIVGQLPEGISEYVFLALTERKGYYGLYNTGLDYCKADFYGYKRKGLWLVYNYLKNNNIVVK